MNNNFQNDMELENMRLQMETLKKKKYAPSDGDPEEEAGPAGDCQRPHNPSLDGKDRRQYQSQILLYHGSLPVDDSIQLLGIRDAKRFLYSFLDFYLHRHAGLLWRHLL